MTTTSIRKASTPRRSKATVARGVDLTGKMTLGEVAEEVNAALGIKVVLMTLRRAVDSLAESGVIHVGRFGTSRTISRSDVATITAHIKRRAASV